MAEAQGVRPYRLFPHQVDRIVDLAEAGGRPAEIARRLGVHVSTVNNVRIRSGLHAPAQRDEAVVIVRAGVEVRRFTRSEDHFIVRQSMAGRRVAEIAAAFAERFGYARRRNCISVRLAMLAALDDNGLQGGA